MKKTACLLFLLSCISAIPQQNDSPTDSCTLQVSLLTCTPGQELYSTFGHSAIRLKDSATSTDIIFNYGTFDFNDPDFYKKFVQGKLLYFVSVDSLHNFLWEYEYFQRGVTEQVLNLDCKTRKELVAALFENAREENKYYLYDFTHDNCTTRLRDMIEKSSGKILESKNILPGAGATFRNLIHEYLNRGGQYWSKLGIDLLLGSHLDREMTNREGMFLPDYLMKGLDSSTLDGVQIVNSRNELLPPPAHPGPKPFFTPLLIFSILFMAVTLFSFITPSRAGLFLKSFDVFFFSLCGLLGLFILFMWFGTDHVMTKNNYNLLWALPTHLPVAILLFSRKNWISIYFRFIFFYTIVLVALWFFLPQHMNTALLPLMGIILVRSYSISKKTNLG